MRPHRIPWIAILTLVLALLGSGCSKRAPEKTTVNRLPDVLSYDETPVGAGDSLVNSVARALGPWMVLWRHAYPGFRADSLIFVGVGPAFRSVDVQPLRDMYPPPKENEAAFRILSAKSPDGRYDLIFDGYQCVQEEDGQIDIGGEADSAPLLLDLKRKTAQRFDFLGPGGGAFHWGAWVSPSRFVLTGTQLDDRYMGVRGRVQIYSLRDSTVTTYVTRPLHSSRSASYQAAWESWVAMRYHATKGVASRS